MSIVVVTGATRGIGRGLTAELAEQGHTVVGCGRAAAHVSELSGALGAPHSFAVVDVVDDAAVAAWAERAIAEHGAPDLLFNNAALINELAPLWEVPVAEFDAVVDVNLKGLTNVIRHFVPAMIERGSGTIVNLSSGWGRSTSPGVAPYCATKWGVEGLTQALAQELPAGLAAVAVSPGTVHTDMLEVAFGDGAAASPKPRAWARQALPKLLAIGPRQTGRPLTIP